MSAINYHSVIPTNLKTAYTEYDNIDFDLAFEGRSLNCGSVCIEGELSVLEGAATIGSRQIFLDHLVGAHSFFENVSVAIRSGSQLVENINEYPRYVKMVNAATLDQGDLCNSDHVCELKAPFDAMTTNIMRGEVPATQSTIANNELKCDPDFSCRPLMSLNSTDAQLSYRASGDIRVSVNLARNAAVFFGYDADSSTNYSLKNLRCTFTSSPDDGSPLVPVGMKVKQYVKQSIQSNFANIQARVGAVCTGMTASFQVQADETTVNVNNLNLNKIPNLTQTQYMFNDSTNTLVSYIIKDNVEVIERALSSMKLTGKNSLNPSSLANNNGFLMGLDFDDAIDLSSQTFSLQINSDISSGIPMIAHMYFHSATEL